MRKVSYEVGNIYIYLYSSSGGFRSSSQVAKRPYRRVRCPVDLSRLDQSTGSARGEHRHMDQGEDISDWERDDGNYQKVLCQG